MTSGRACQREGDQRGSGEAQNKYCDKEEPGEYEPDFEQFSKVGEGRFSEGCRGGSIQQGRAQQRKRAITAHVTREIPRALTKALTRGGI